MGEPAQRHPFTGYLRIADNTTVRAGTYELSNVHFAHIRVDGAGSSVGREQLGTFHFTGTSEFSLEDQGGNDGVDNNEYHLGTNWFTPYVPDATTCNDRPSEVAPPAPSAW